MNYVQNTEADRRAMLDVVGVGSVEALMATIPEDCRFAGPLDVERALTEDELLREMRALASRNAGASGRPSFLGAGLYNHFCPALVDSLVARTEYWTAYTPYQPEASQGTLTIIYEWQTMMCRLTGMEVSNASLYDGATAVVEALLMALRLRESSQPTHVVLSRGLHPDAVGAVKTYMGSLGIGVLEVDLADGATPAGALAQAVAAAAPGRGGGAPVIGAVAVQNPNFVGVIEDVGALCDAAHALGALAVVSADPVALSVLEAPGAQGADIVCGEATPMGNKPWFGGPGVGYLCARMDSVRQMPARIAGETVDGKGRRAVVLTFQTREQHIRRAKATSNICTSQQLMALRATIWMSLLGKQGFVELGRTNLARAHYAAERIAALPGWKLTYPAQAFFKEFCVTGPVPAARVNRELLRRHDIIGGFDIGRVDPARPNDWLLAVTDMNAKDEIDRLVLALETIR